MGFRIWVSFGEEGWYTYSEELEGGPEKAGERRQ